MSRRRSPRSQADVLAGGTVAGTRVGGALLMRNAAPLADVARATAAALASVATGSAKSSFIDIFTLAGDGPQDLALTYLPAEGSHNVDVNGIKALFGTDYTISGQTLSLLLTPPEAIAGDEVQIQYDYLSGQPTELTDYGSDYATAVMADSPLVYYRMDGTGSTEEDVTSNNRDGTLSGDYIRSRPGLLTSDSDTCTDFGDGSQRIGAIGTPGSYVTCPYDSGLITPDFTFECWTSKGTSGLTPMMQQDNRIKIALGGVGFFQVSFWDGASWVVVSASAGGIITGSDYATARHLAVVFDSTANTVTYYADGSLFDIDTGVTANLLSASSGLHFGWVSGSSGLPDLDEVAWYGAALTSDQIRAHWDAR